MEALQQQLMKAQIGNDRGVYSNPVEALGPEYRGNHKHAIQRLVLSDTLSWSLNSQENLPAGSTTTIQLAQKGLIDLRRSYIQFKIDGNNGRVYNTNSIFEVLNWSIGSLQFNGAYPQPLNECLQYRRDRKEVAESGVMGDWVYRKFFSSADDGNEAAMQADIPKHCLPQDCTVQIPFCDLHHQFKELGHVFVGLGQTFQIQLRSRRAEECMVWSGAGSYTIGQGQIVLQYVELDQGDMDMIIKSRIQFPLSTHQVQPQKVALSMNYQLSVSKQDQARFLLFGLQGQSANVAIAANAGGEISNYMTGVTKPRMPIRRITIVLGQQQIILNAQRITTLADLNLSDFKFTHQWYSNQQAFAPIAIDLTRFGLRFDEQGSEQGSSGQVLLVTVELDSGAGVTLFGPNNSLFTGLYNAANSAMTCYCYLVSHQQFSIENGMYKRD